MNEIVFVSLTIKVDSLELTRGDGQVATGESVCRLKLQSKPFHAGQK